jgi:hypothetical protein
MKKVLPFLFLVAFLVLGTFGGELLKPFTSYFTKSLIDNDNPFNFKNEYELLIFQNKQDVTKEVFINTLSNVELNFEVDDKEDFAQCVIDENIESLNRLAKNDPKLNPINPKTVNELDNELKKYQPILIEVQIESINKCSPEKEPSSASNIIRLACECENVIAHPQSILAKQGNDYCGSPIIRNMKSAVINLKFEVLTYGRLGYPLKIDPVYYTGIDTVLQEMGTAMRDCEKRSGEDKNVCTFFETTLYPGVTIERLTRNLDYYNFSGFETESGYFKEQGALPRDQETGMIIMLASTPAYTVKRQCSLASNL